MPACPVAHEIARFEKWFMTSAMIVRAGALLGKWQLSREAGAVWAAKWHVVSPPKGLV